MLARIYAFMWLLLAGTAASLYFSGYLNEKVLLLAGFATAALVFMGMMVVVPLSVSKQSAPRY